MSDPRFKNIGLPGDKVMEECAELTQEICKAMRFGLYNFHPKEPGVTNKDRILREMKDVEDAITEYRRVLEEKK